MAIEVLAIFRSDGNRVGSSHTRERLLGHQARRAVDRPGKPVGGLLPRRKGARYFRARAAHAHDQQHSAADSAAIDSVRRDLAFSGERAVRRAAYVSGFEVGNEGADSVSRHRASNGPAASVWQVLDAHRRSAVVRRARSSARAGSFRPKRSARSCATSSSRGSTICWAKTSRRSSICLLTTTSLPPA